MIETDHPLRAWRAENNKMTLADLAGEVGCTQSHLSEIECGRNKPSLDLAAKLSQRTGIPMDRFVVQTEAAE